ncbi:metallophosphoesterase [Anaerostipes sp.]|uniref:metallophosphoesterase n=1 Tax=Anaerostipes sp. TaxID=1872530 RepID=UPI0025C117DE|nr:metallophosphoesterase [Anaerostipes sp.]MBS7009290.1 metallophosphoesterase [Anaerostipes sp.]
MKIIKRIVLFILLILIVSGLLAAYAVKIEPYRLVVRDYQLKKGNTSTELKVVHISDIQVSRSYTENRLDKLVEKINSQEPDFVLFTGDLYDNYADYHPENKVEKAFSEMKAKYGKFAVWGNRDYGGGAMRAYSKIMENGGFQLLTNQTRIVSLPDGKTVCIGGLDDVLFGKPDYTLMEAENIKKCDYRILMLHEPDAAERLSDKCADLVLAGHSHGGQVKLPFFKMKTSLAKKYTDGFYSVNGMKLFVNTGIGTSHYSVRFLVPPEIDVFHISF